MRFFDVRPVDPFRAVRTLRALGQDLFDPPNVKGWPGGIAWITSNRSLRRTQFLRNVMRGRGIGSRQEIAAVAFSRSMVEASGSKAMAPAMGTTGNVRRMDMGPLVMATAKRLGKHL